MVSRCGYVAILGAPNAGKSTLMNRLVGQKLSIVSPKVQTTRTKVLGIQVTGGAQIIYVDTPGIFQPKRRLDRAMVAAAWTGAGDADEIVLLIDAESGLNKEVREIVAELKNRNRKGAVALNKIDAVKRDSLLALAASLDAEGIFERIFMISALTGAGVNDLEAWLLSRLPEGPFLYPEDQLSDMPQRLLAAEITREQLYLQLHDELPYAATVETESWEDLFFRLLLGHIEPHLGQTRPSFLTHWPAAQAALARRDPTDPRVAERFELYVCGMELANAFIELTDAAEQRARFAADRARRHVLNGETDWPLDEEFLAALEHGMPPAGGVAMGFDRLAMIASGADRIDQVKW